MAELLDDGGTDAAIARLLAGGPLPTAIIAARLAVPERTVRHRLLRLRETGRIVTDSVGLHHLAGSGPADRATPRPGEAAARAGLAGTGDLPGSAGGAGATITVLAVVLLCLAAAVLVGRRHPAPARSAAGVERAGDIWSIPW